MENVSWSERLCSELEVLKMREFLKRRNLPGQSDLLLRSKESLYGMVRSSLHSGARFEVLRLFQWHRLQRAIERPKLTNSLCSGSGAGFFRPILSDAHHDVPVQ